MASRLTIGVATTLALAATGAAVAQPKAQHGADPALARAQSIIDGAGAKGLFTAGATAAGSYAQHVKSGMVCRFEPTSTANQIKIFDSGATRGDDVGCGAKVRGITSTLFAVRSKSDADVPKTETQTLADFKRQFPDAVEYKGAVSGVTDKGRPIMAIARMSSPSKGQFMRAVAFRMGGWVYSQTIIAPAASAVQADDYAETQLTILIKDIRAGRAL